MGLIIALVVEFALYRAMPNDILKLAVFIVPGVGAFIFQIVDYIRKKSIRKKAEKENAENIDYVKNDYNEVSTQDKINGSEQLKLESKEIKKNNNTLLSVIVIIALLIGGVYAYSYFHTLSNNWQWEENGRCYIDKYIEYKNHTYYFGLDGKMVKNASTPDGRMASKYGDIR